MKHLVWFLLTLVVASAGQAVVVTGTVKDAAGNPIEGMRVEIWDEGVFVDELLDVDYTENGAFSSAAPEPGHDVFVRAKWEFALLPSTDYNGRVVRILDLGPGIPPNGTLTFTETTSDTSEDVSDNDTLFFEIDMSEGQPPALDVLVARIQETLDFVRTRVDSRQDIAWVVDYDIPVHILTGTNARHNSGEVFIPSVAYNGAGTASNQINLFHELGHLIHYRHNGDTMPPRNNGCQNHTINSEEDPGCAVIEGYAYYIAQLIAESHQPAPIVNPFHRAYRDDGLGMPFPANTLWRGDEGGAVTVSTVHSGRNSNESRFENGEVVEGAFSGFLFSVHGAFDFATNFAAMHNHDPETPLEVAQALVADAGGGGTAAATAIYDLMQSHGIVYSRAIFAEEPFVDIEPANEAPPAPGNKKLIDGLTFLRGTVTARVATASGEIDLGVDSDRVIDQSRVKIGFKRAVSGTTDAANLFVSFTEPVDFGFFSDEVPLDTSAFDASSSDGTWDLIVVGENEDGFVDNLLPSWFGDGNVGADTDERYFKLLGAWLDGDGRSSTEDDGMVMIDNTAPVVTQFMPQ